MIPWQEFSGKEVSQYASQLTDSISSEPTDAANCSSAFGSLFDNPANFDEIDRVLINSAEILTRLFTLPNNHSEGLSFFGAQGDNFSANGAGNCAENALRSCLGESLERWTLHNTMQALSRSADITTIRKTNCPQSAKKWFATQQNVNANIYDENSQWIVAESLAKNETILVPLDFVYRLESTSEKKNRAETNGMSTGRCDAHAISAALLELIERDSLSHWWYGDRQASMLQLSTDLSFKVISYLTRARRGSSRPCWLIAIENEFDIPVIAALSSDQNGFAIIAGFGSDTDVFNACCSAIAELGQMELGLQLAIHKLRDSVDNALTANDLSQLDRAKNLNIERYPELYPVNSYYTLNTSVYDSYSDKLEKLITCIENRGFTPFSVNMSSEHYNIPCYKVIVPGLDSCNIDRCSERLSMKILKSPEDKESLRKKARLF